MLWVSKPIKVAVAAKGQIGADFIVDVKANSNGSVQVKSEMKIMNKENLTKNLKQIFLNPILIATIIGFIFWVTQLIPGIAVVPDQNNIGSGHYFSPLRLDNTFPPLFKVTKTLEAVCTPLAWLAIGMTLAKGNFKEAAQDKKVWFGMVMKIIFAPLFGLVLVCALAAIGKGTGAWKLDTVGLSVVVIMLAAPPASVIVAYSIAYKRTIINK